MASVELCVIVNPRAGRRRARAARDRLRRALGARATFWPTAVPGDGEVSHRRGGARRIDIEIRKQALEVYAARPAGAMDDT
jgi:hypothetical protein